jgi:hypothetical protein
MPYDSKMPEAAKTFPALIKPIDRIKFLNFMGFVGVCVVGLPKIRSRLAPGMFVKYAESSI